MNTSIRVVQGALTVTFSHLVKAKSKSHALEMADFNMNVQNILLDRVLLVNSNGIKKWVTVDQIIALQWLEVERSEYCDLYLVTGLISLTIHYDLRMGKRGELMRKLNYQFPASSLIDHPVWVIPTLRDPVFTQVLSQNFELKEDSKHSKSTKVC